MQFLQARFVADEEYFWAGEHFRDEVIALFQPARELFSVEYCRRYLATQLFLYLGQRQGKLRKKNVAHEEDIDVAACVVPSLRCQWKLYFSTTSALVASLKRSISCSSLPSISVQRTRKYRSARGRASHKNLLLAWTGPVI